MYTLCCQFPARGKSYVEKRSAQAYIYFVTVSNWIGRLPVSFLQQTKSQGQDLPCWSCPVVRLSVAGLSRLKLHLGLSLAQFGLFRGLLSMAPSGSVRVSGRACYERLGCQGAGLFVLFPSSRFRLRHYCLPDSDNPVGKTCH